MNEPTAIQRYKSISSFSEHHNLMLPRPFATWRLLQMPVLGSVNGLEKRFRGLAMATNGIIVAIETSADEILFAHLQWFVKDNPEEQSDLDLAMKGVLAQRKKMQCVDLFNDLFQDETV